ncbi:hypothetical protein D915_007016 [Fasciola hepatica]|uniref:Cysteine/serine-rich nuclear protein N-terminal domain-containing protein n=1 Tax=Fasciola hepatica TaxID=6192 RepID=A0A4E0R559_FASHE|nr:hypothetical protein D915_007016 [Fasciola hepatica]
MNKSKLSDEGKGKTAIPTVQIDSSLNCSKNVRFSTVVVYSFAREQGFSSIPDTGWCSLGMARKHQTVSRFDVHHHQLIQRLRRRRERLSQKSRITSGVGSHALLRMKGRFRGGIQGSANRRGPLRLSPGDSCRVPTFPSPPPLSPQPYGDTVNHADPSYSVALTDASVRATPPPPCLSPPSPRRVLGHLDESLAASNTVIVADGFDTDSEASLDQIPSVNLVRSAKSNRGRSKLMPIHGTARIKLLKESGVTRLDESERDVCLRIRATRSRVGCDCGPRYPCTPGRCSCIEEGIQCQVDRPSFPCSCMVTSCHNPNGRTEFSMEEVRTHVQNILRNLTKQQEDKNRQCETGHCSLSLLSVGDTGPQFVHPRLVGFKEMSTNDASAKTVTIQFTENSISSPLSVGSACSPTGATIPTPFHDWGTRQTSVTDVVENQSFNWISSTPASQEHVRKVLFQDLHTADQYNLNASVSLPRLRSPEITAMYSPMSSQRQPPVPDSIPVKHKSSDVSSVTTPVFRCKKFEYRNRRNRNCRTPVPRRPSVSAVQHARRILSKSMSAVVNPVVSVSADGNCVSNNGGNVCLPKDSTDWLAEATVSPVSSNPAYDLTQEHSSSRLTWDVLHQESTQLLTDHPFANTNDFMSEPLSLPVDTPSTSVSASAPCTSPAKNTTRLPLRSYASYRMRSSPFASKSAPNSPCSLHNPSLGRLSLRRRAIPRLPVTPSRRVARSPRTPNPCISQNLVHSRNVAIKCDLNDCVSGSPPECTRADGFKPICAPVCGRTLSPKTCATASQETSVLTVSPTLPSISRSS